MAEVNLELLPLCTWKCVVWEPRSLVISHDDISEYVRREGASGLWPGAAGFPGAGLRGLTAACVS